MAFKIVVLPSAREDIVEAVDHIAKDSRESARRWYDGLWRTIFSLADSPASYPPIPESAELGLDLRQIHHHSHRIVFRVQGDEVQVLRIYHGARRALRTKDLP